MGWDGTGREIEDGRGGEGRGGEERGIEEGRGGDRLPHISDSAGHPCARLHEEQGVHCTAREGREANIGVPQREEPCRAPECPDLLPEHRECSPLQARALPHSTGLTVPLS